MTMRRNAQGSRGRALHLLWWGGHLNPDPAVRMQESTVQGPKFQGVRAKNDLKWKAPGRCDTVTPVASFIYKVPAGRYASVRAPGTSPTVAVLCSCAGSSAGSTWPARLHRRAGGEGKGLLPSGADDGGVDRAAALRRRGDRRPPTSRPPQCAPEPRITGGSPRTGRISGPHPLDSRGLAPAGPRPAALS